jgi:hypothetical protein
VAGNPETRADEKLFPHVAPFVFGETGGGLLFVLFANEYQKSQAVSLPGGSEFPPFTLRSVQRFFPFPIKNLGRLFPMRSEADRFEACKWNTFNLNL